MDRLEPGLLQQLPPACARQATSNSSRPEIDIADRGLGNRLAVGDIGELQVAAGPHHALDLGKDSALVCTEINDPVADDDIGPIVLILDYRQSTSDNTDDPVELTPYATWKPYRVWVLTGYGVFGATDGSPDHGGGLQVSYTWEQ